MLHGAGGGAWEWQIWRRQFEAQQFVVSTPNFEPHLDQLEQTNYAHYRAQALYALAQMRVQNSSAPLVLIGASLGGLIALDIAVECNPSALILINPMPPKDIAPELTPIVPYPDRIEWGSARNFKSTQDAMFDCDDSTIHFAHQHWRDESGLVLNQASREIVVAPFGAECLVIGSELDRDIPSSVSARIARDFNASFIKIPRASHLGPLMGRSANACAKLACDWIATLKLVY